jgi:hypothetical protein
MAHIMLDIHGNFVVEYGSSDMKVALLAAGFAIKVLPNIPVPRCVTMSHI